MIFKKSGYKFNGFTLLELIISAVLLLILLGLVFSFLIPATRASIKGSIRAEIQQEAMRTMNNIISDLTKSSGSAISITATMNDPETGPVAVAMVKIKDILPECQREWEQSLILYYWQGKGQPVYKRILSSSECGIPLSANSPAKLSQSSLLSLAGSAGVKGQVLARDVDEFRITTAGFGNVLGSPVKLLIRIKRKAASGGGNEEIFDISRSIKLRN